MNKKFSTLVAAALVAGGFSSSALAEVVSPGDTIAYNKLVNGQKYQISTKLGYKIGGETEYFLDTLQVRENPAKADSKYVLTLKATTVKPSALFKTTVTTDGGKKYVKLSVDGKEIQLKNSDGGLLANTADDYLLSTVSRLDSATMVAATLNMDSVQLFANSGALLTVASGATILSVDAYAAGNATSFRFSIPENVTLPIANLNAYLFNGFILNAKNGAAVIGTEANGLFNKKLMAITLSATNLDLSGVVTDAEKALNAEVAKLLGAAAAANQSPSKTYYFIANDALWSLAPNGAITVTTANKADIVAAFKKASVVAVDKVKSESTVNVTAGYGYVFTNKTGKELLEAGEKDVPVNNAWFATAYNPSDATVVENADGSLKSTDNIVITVDAKFPASDGKMTVSETVRPQISTIGGKSYLYTIPANTKVTQWSQIGFGATSQVAYATFKGKVFNVISAEKNSDLSDKVLASMAYRFDSPIAWEKAADVMKTKPEGQWVVTYVETATDSKIFEFFLNNRETGKKVNMGTTIYAVDNTTDKYYVYDTDLGGGLVAGADTIQLVEAAACAHARLNGYAHSEVAGDKFDAIKLATTAYRLGIKNGDTDGIVYVQNSSVHNNTLSVAVKENEGLSFYLVPSDTISYGINIDSKGYYENVGDKADSLRAVVYKIQERGNKRYVAMDADEKYVLDNNVNAAQNFLLKEREDGQYVILPVSYGDFTNDNGVTTFYGVYINGKVYANIGDGFLHVENDMYRKNIADAFGLYESESPKYANILKEINKGDTTLVKVNLSSVQNHVGDGFYMLAPGANNFLYEGVPAKGSLKAEGGLAYDSTAFSLVIDTAYVNRGAGSEIMPLYYIAMNGAARLDSVGPLHVGEKDQFDHPVACEHYADNDTVIGKYLFAMYDSIMYGKDKTIKSEDHCYHYTNTNHYARLRFVDAMHINDTVIIGNDVMAAAPKDILKAATVGATTLAERKVFEWMSGFAPALTNTHFGDLSFNNDNFGLFAFEINPTNDKEYAIYSPATGYYVAYLNGNVVMAPQASYYTLNVGTKNNPIVSNDDIQATEVSVIAGNGQVVINNAAGKTVVISNILGQTIANTVLASDNATIAVPAGIVVVAVEGEAAVKAIIK